MTEPVVLVVGSLHHDIMVEAENLPARDETAVGSGWHPKLGGKGGNQAVGVVRAGGRARMLGAVGADPSGAFLMEGLVAGGVETGFVETLAGHPSGMSVAIVDPAGDYAAAIVSGANMQIDAARLADAALWDGVAALLLQNEVTGALNRAAALEARRRGVRVIHNAAPARPLADWAEATDILVVNAVEAEMLTGIAVRDLASAATAAAALAARVPAVVATAGAAGLAACTAAGEAFRLPARAVKVRSTHGAGDAFCGALGAAVARGIGLAEACEEATAAAARHVAGERSGAV